MFKIKDIHVGDYIAVNDHALYKVVKVRTVNVTYLNYWGVETTVRFDKIKYLVYKDYVKILRDNNKLEPFNPSIY